MRLRVLTILLVTVGCGSATGPWDDKPPFHFATLSVGGYHNCGLTVEGTAYCWGANFSGELGIGTTPSADRASDGLTPVAVKGGPTFTALVLGTVHSCGRTNAGAAYCWGSNGSGTLGDGTRTNRSTPVAVLGGLAFTDLSVGYGHSCGLAGDGQAYCWGENFSGQLGDGTTITSSPFGRPSPIAVEGGFAFASLAAGESHACGLTKAGAAYCWGSTNDAVGVGDGTVGPHLVPVAVATGLVFTSLTAGGGHTCGLTSDGAAYCWGHNPEGALGDGTTTSRLTPTAVIGGLIFSSLSAGGSHTCGLTRAGAAYCWGANYYGALGDRTTTRRLTPVAVYGVHVFTSLGSGGVHTCGLTNTVVYCWGGNGDGQLGDGTTTARAIPGAVIQP